MGHGYTMSRRVGAKSWLVNAWHDKHCQQGPGSGRPSARGLQQVDILTVSTPCKWQNAAWVDAVTLNL